MRLAPNKAAGLDKSEADLIRGSTCRALQTKRLQSILRTTGAPVVFWTSKHNMSGKSDNYQSSC